MPEFTLSLETTSQSNTGGAVQWLMPAARHCFLKGVDLRLISEASNRDIGRWVVDRISAIGTTNWGAQTPFEVDPGRAPSAISDATKTIATACNGSGATQVDAAMADLHEGWNDLDELFAPLGLWSGIAQGFVIRRATAPSGARVLGITVVWEE